MKPSYEELEEQLNRSRRLCDAALANERVWETTMMQACGEDGPKSVVDKFAELEARCAALAAENAGLKQRTQQLIDIISNTDNDYCMCGSAMKDHVHGGCGYPTGMFDYYYNQWLESDNKTPATDAFLAEVRASAIPDEATERDLFEEWVMEKIFISKTTLEGLRTDDGYRNSTLSGTDYNGMWSQWKAIRAAQLRQEAAQ